MTGTCTARELVITDLFTFVNHHASCLFKSCFEWAHCRRHPCLLARKTHRFYAEFGLDSHRYLPMGGQGWLLRNFGVIMSKDRSHGHGWERLGPGFEGG